jgi:hypothetical protein
MCGGEGSFVFSLMDIFFLFLSFNSPTLNIIIDQGQTVASIQNHEDKITKLKK